MGSHKKMISSEEYRKIYLRLPEKVKKIYTSEETANKIISIGKKYDLHIDQQGALADTVGWVIVGIIKTDDFVSRLEQQLKVDYDHAQAIAHDVDAEIFAQIREEIKSLADNTDTKERVDAKMFEQKVTPPPVNLPTADRYREPIEVTSDKSQASSFETKLSQPSTIPLPEIKDPYREPLD